MCKPFVVLLKSELIDFKPALAILYCIYSDAILI